MTGDQQAIGDLWAFMEPERPEPRDEDLWDLPPADEARRLRDQGAEVALNAADTRGRLAGEEAIRQLARSGREFTAEDVRELVGAPLACGPNVLGALLLAAARRDEITATGYTKAARASSRSRVLRTWRGTGRAGLPPGGRNDPSGASDAHTAVFSTTPEGDGGGPPPHPAPPDRAERGLGGPAGKSTTAPSAGTWTAADVTAPCVRCQQPAFMRDPDGRPRHRADCTGEA